MKTPLYKRAKLRRAARREIALAKLNKPELVATVLGATLHLFSSPLRDQFTTSRKWVPVETGPWWSTRRKHTQKKVVRERVLTGASTSPIVNAA